MSLHLCLVNYQRITTYMYMGILGTGAMKDKREGILGNLTMLSVCDLVPSTGVVRDCFLMSTQTKAKDAS